MHDDSFMYIMVIMCIIILLLVLIRGSPEKLPASYNTITTQDERETNDQ